jgi:maltooligosyltrehalose trehalohydrolase
MAFRSSGVGPEVHQNIVRDEETLSTMRVRLAPQGRISSHRRLEFQMLDTMPEFGATPISGDRCRFIAWAPAKSELSLVLDDKSREVILMQAQCGFHVAEARARQGARYLYRMPDGREFPDPASRFQPDGVHRASAVVDTRSFKWTDSGFAGHSMREFVIYELHVGTFTPSGTFDRAISRLDDLAELGITAVELMPVAQFPGGRNWGYDGVYPFATQNSYGGPAGLQRFVDAAHARGMSVILDVVYNHLGPEGNYFGEFGPFFSRRYCTPWGQAINFDGPESEPVRAFFIQNALYWLREFHIDALRLDAVHGIFDFSARHFLAELKEHVQDLAAQTNRKMNVIAESDLNDSRLLHRPVRGGYGMDAQWSDDFHHALHALLTKESTGYYGDFGTIEDLGVAIRDGWRYSGQFSQFRKRRHGNSPVGISPDHFVVFSQNHDQVGNRAGGERLADLVNFESLKLAAGVTLLSPFVPLLFMGEEYGEKRPFQYFTSHGDEALIEAVRRGRREEFAQFGWGEEVGDPQDEATFAASVLNDSARDAEPQRTLCRLYKSLLALRKGRRLGSAKPEVTWNESARTLTIEYPTAPLLAIFHFGQKQVRVPLPIGLPSASAILNSAHRDWRGPWQGELAAETQDGTVTLEPSSFAVLIPQRGLTP